MMGRKQYDAVAALLAQERRMAGSGQMCPECGSPEDSMLDRIAEDAADLFAADNPRFDRARFLAAVKGER